MSDETDDFEDAGLCGALRERYASHRAPSALRGKITHELARGSRLRAWIAVAASLLLAVGAAGFYIHRHSVADAAEHVYAQNKTLLNAMVRSHLATTTCPAETTLATGNARDLSTQAAQRLGRPMPVIDLQSQGWIADSACTCNIVGLPSLRIHFTHGAQNASVLSLPAAAYAGASDGDHYELLNNGYSIAGYVSNGSLTCVVGDPSVSLTTAAQLRDSLRANQIFTR